MDEIASANWLSKTVSLLGFTPFFATSTAASISSFRPFPVLAAMGTTGAPRISESLPQSILSPLPSTSSIMFMATTMGIRVSIICMVRYRFLSMLVPSTILITASGFSFTM